MRERLTPLEEREQRNVIFTLLQHFAHRTDCPLGADVIEHFRMRAGLVAEERRRSLLEDGQ